MLIKVNVMNQYLKFSLLGLVSFILGFQLKGKVIENQSSEGRVTGIGGIFFKCKILRTQSLVWGEFRDKVNQYGAVFEWRQGLDSSQKGFTQWSPFNEKTKYFDPSTKEFMINFRVDNLDKLLHKLNQNHISILDTIEAFDYGKFLHIMDLEGNKSEWEPNDIAYEKLGKASNVKRISRQWELQFSQSIFQIIE